MQEIDLYEIRELFSKASESSFYTEKLSQKLEKTNSNPLIIAYKACVKALQAKYTWNPLQKWADIDQASKFFEEAIKDAPEDIEIRFLRFSIELNTPSILGYSQHLEEDKKKLLLAFPFVKLPQEMKEAIKKSLLESNLCSLEEKKCLV
jgi:hypothetical protein